MADYGSDLTGGQTYDASNEISASYDASKAFDDSTSTYWGVTGASFPEWIECLFSSAQKIAKLRMYKADAGQGPEDFTLKASNTGSFSGEEVTLLTVNNHLTTGWSEWEFANATEYLYYRVVVTEVGSGTTIRLNEIEMMAEQIVGEVGDDFSINDNINAFSLTDDIQDQFTMADEIIAAGGSSEVSISDHLTVEDLVSGGLDIEVDVPDALTINDEITVGFEYQGAIQDVFNISDLTDVLLWSEWLRENYGKYAIRYYCTLTGDADNESDLELKQSSFQATKRNGSATYLTVIIPGFEYSSSITARSNGDLKIDMAYLIDGVESLRENIVDVILETIRTDEGPRRRSISLSGSRTIDYKGNLITMENPIYKNISEGKIRYRFLQADPWLNPGDTVRCRSDEFVVDYITYNISQRFRQMEVSET